MSIRPTFLGLALDPKTHDFYMDDTNNLAVVKDNHAVGQHVKQRLNFYEGEWFLDQLAGLPWFQEVFVRPTNQPVIEAIIKREILETPGISELLSFDMRLDLKNRGIYLDAIASSTMDDGLTIEVTR